MKFSVFDGLGYSFLISKAKFEFSSENPPFNFCYTKIDENLQLKVYCNIETDTDTGLNGSLIYQMDLSICNVTFSNYLNNSIFRYNF